MTDPMCIAWEQTAPAWDAPSQGYAAELAPRAALFAADVIALLELSPGSRFLDVACGTGVVATCAARAGHAVAAVDFSAGMTRHVKQVAARGRLRIDIRQMDGQQLSFPDGCFEGAASLFGLQFFPDRCAGLRELRRVIVDKGSVAIGV